MATTDMRIAMITQWYDPEQGSAIMPGTIARALTQLGNVVDVVTGFPNYPDGRLYPGYRVRRYQREQLQGVTVHRAPLYVNHDANPRRRAANYLSFAASASAIAVTRLGKPQATLVHSTPATAAIPAMALRALRGTPYVVHVQDLWPQTVIASGFLAEGQHRQVEALLHRFCDRVYHQAASIAVTSPGMVDLIAGRGVEPRKISVIPDWADERHFRPATPSAEITAEFGLGRPFNVMYAGAMGELQSLEVLIDAATILRDRDDIGFILVGGGVSEPALRARSSKARLENIRFIGHQPVERMASVLSLGDAQIISLKDLPIFRTTMPSKIQATMAAGRPIICAVAGDASDVIRDSGAGLTTTPGSAVELAEAIQRAAAMPSEQWQAYGDRGRRYYLDHLSEASGAAALNDLLQTAVRGGT
ncbi:MAG: glycosyltransferase family 4 protein [Cellulomonas sp.]|uniref:glycosyltransferase family 4 protein n=1 Tax=Cellulomonas sp. TaxID=40001 RepID=UPI0018289651|nr:glycosyltransferase family 4 protein [Cellulomonas sp.]NMM30637.1 glycosyltransferase family 4 protein [Cellulomonas sp.]